MAVTTVFQQLICIWCNKIIVSHTMKMMMVMKNVLSWFKTEWWTLQVKSQLNLSAVNWLIILNKIQIHHLRC